MRLSENYFDGYFRQGKKPQLKHLKNVTFRSPGGTGQSEICQKANVARLMKKGGGENSTTNRKTVLLVHGEGGQRSVV